MNILVGHSSKDANADDAFIIDSSDSESENQASVNGKQNNTKNVHSIGSSFGCSMFLIQFQKSKYDIQSADIKIKLYFKPVSIYIFSEIR